MVNYTKAAVPPPTNDECTSAIPLTVGTTCNYTQYTNEGATNSTGVPAPGCANYQGGDVWFSVVVPASGSLIFDSNTGVVTDGGMAIYTGTCGSLTLVGCDDDGSANGLMPSLSQTGLVPGTTVYIRFWEYGNDNPGTFSICVTAGIQCNSSTANSACSQANPFCTGVSTDFCNTTGVTSLGGGGIYGCCLSTPNPAFYFLQIANSGPITFQISQNTFAGVGIDVDYVIWGPFASQGAMCAGLSANNIVSCSYSTAAVETATIPNALAGEFYMVLITNFSNQPGVINFNQTNSGASGAGATNCSTVAVTPGPCLGSGLFDLTGSVYSDNPPATGILTVTNSCGGSIIFNPPFSNTTNFSFPNLCSDGSNCTVSAAFSVVNGDTILPTTYTAPICNNFTALAGACNGGTYVMTGTLNIPCNIPSSGNLTITSSCGGSVTFNAPFSFPLNWSLPPTTGNGGNCNINAVFSAPGAPIISQIIVPQPTCCSADAGTITVTQTNGTQTVLPNGTVQVVLCPGGSVSLVSNNDYTLPPSFDPGYDDAELFYAIYSYPGPTVPNPDLDPNWTGYYWTGQDFTNANSGGYNSNTNGACSPILTLPDIVTSNNTLIYVPITADDGNNGLNWNGVVAHDQNGDGCFDLGNPIAVTYLNPLSITPSVTCGGSVNFVINGGYPQFFNGVYTISNTGSGTLSSTSATSGGTVTISGLTSGQNYSISVIDPSGCSTVSYSGTYNGAPSVSISPTLSTVCEGQCVNIAATINANVSGGISTYSNNSCTLIADNGIGNNNNGPATVTGNWATSAINISGFCGTNWSTGNLLTVCLNINHTFDGDLNIFLQAPNGVYVKLSDDNGGGGSDYLNTCFSTTAITAITAGTAPFSGSYVPEGTFNSFNGTPINGTWTLWVADDASGDIGTISNWSITFQNQNTYTYSWSPVAGLSATNILNPQACPTANTTYSLSVTNSCGCTSIATTTINVTPSTLQTPNITNPSSVCSGSNGVFTLTGTPNTSVVYNLNGGTSQTIVLSPTGTGTVTIPSLTTSQTLNLTSISNVSCSQNIAVSSTITPFPVTTVTATNASPSICSPGNSNIVNLNSSLAGTTFDWSSSDGQSGTNLSIGGSIFAPLTSLICPNNIVNFTITPKLNGCYGIPLVIPVSVIPKPTSTFAVNPFSVCQNDNITVTYTGSAPCSPSTFNWTWPTGTTVISGSGSGPYVINVPPNGGNVKLQVVSPTGACTSTTTTLPVVVNPKTQSITTISRCINQLPYNWNGTNYNTAGNYTYNTTNANGCDSLAILNITILNTTTSNNSISVCPSQLPYLWNGLIFNGAGTQVAHLTNAAGCDSAASLTVTISATSTNTTNISLCPSQLPYTWGSHVVNSGGTFLYGPVPNSVGCDSTTILNVTIKPTSTSIRDSSICLASLPITWNGLTFNTAGTQVAHLTNSVGCDSAVTMNVIIKPTSSSTTYHSICINQLPYLWNGVNYNSSGSFIFNTTNAAGCDSIATLILTVNPVYIALLNATICQGQSYNLPWGGTATTANTYSHTYSTASGCDSVVNITLSISSTFITNNTASICQGQSYSLPWGGTATTANTYSHTYSTASGCDSVVNITLTVNPIYTTNQTASICQGQSYNLPWGGTATTANTYSHTYSTVSGCDSVVNIILTVNNITPVSTTITACETYTWNGISYNASGDYTYSYINVSGCLSVDTLHLTINYGTHNTTSQIACVSYTWNGNTYTSSGNYLYNYVNSSGCFSTDTLHLTITNGTHQSIIQTACNNFFWNGNSYSNTGIYIYHYTDVNGCASADTLHLTVFTPTSSTTQVAICSSQIPYIWNGQSLTTSGSYSTSLVNQNGCDSLAIIQLTVNPTPPAPQVIPNQTLCQYSSTLPLSASGTYPLLWYSNPTGGTGSAAAPTPSSSIYGISHYYVSQINGNCESPRSEIIIRVVNKPDLGLDKDLHICFGETINLNTYFNTGNMTTSWTSNNSTVPNPNVVSISGEYQLVAVNSFGCHDTALVQLTVQPQLIANAGPDDNAVFNEPYPLHGSGGMNYMWSPANFLNFATIANPLAVLTDDTEFILSVSDDFGCTDKDTVFIRVFKGPTFYIPNAFTPNGDGVNDNFKPTYVGIQKLEYFRVYDRYGVLVFETSNIGKSWDGMYKNKTQNTGNYVYIIKGIDKNGKEKILKGNVVLIR